MSRKRWLTAWVVALSLSGGGLVEAASTDADGTYTVTVTKVEISQDGTAFTTIFSGSQAMNIASVNAGAVAAGLVGGTALPMGTYTAVRVTIGATLLAKGYVNSGGTTVYTNGGTDAAGFSTIAGNNNTTAGDYASSTYTIPAAFRTNTTTGLSITVSPGAAVTMRISFDTSGVLSLNTGVIVPGAPSITISSG